MAESAESIDDGDHYEQQVHPLVEILRNRPVKVIELLQRPKLLEEIEQCNLQFSSELATQAELEREIIDCTVRPELLQDRGIQLAQHYPYVCSQLLTTLCDGYIDSLFERIDTAEDGGPILYLFELLKRQEYLNEAALGYLLKIVSHLLCSQHGSKIMPIFDYRKSLTRDLLRHFYSPSVVEIFLLVAGKERADSEERDYETMKLEILDALVKSLELDSLPDTKEERVEATTQFINEMVSKSIFGERFQPLIEHLLSTNTVAIILSLFERNSISDQQVPAVLDLLESCFGYYKPRTINTRFGGNQQSMIVPKPPPELRASFKDAVVRIAKKVVVMRPAAQYPAATRVELAFAQLFQSYCKLWPELTKESISSDVCGWALKLYPLHPHNNILHNALTVIVDAYIENTPLDSLLTDSTLNILDFIIQHYQTECPQGKTNHTFQQHLVMMLDRLFNQPLGSYDIDSLINKHPQLTKWDQIKQHHTQTKLLQSQELCKQTTPPPEESLFDEEEEVVVMKFDPNMPGFGSFSGLFNSSPQDGLGFQLSFLPNDSDVVVCHADGMAESILAQIQNEIGQHTPTEIKTPKLFDLKSPKNIQQPQANAQKPSPITQLRSVSSTTDIGVQTATLCTENDEEENIHWFPQEVPPSTLDLLIFFKDTLFQIAGQVWYSLWA